MSRILDAGSIATALVGVLLVAGFSTYADRDEKGYGTMNRWVDLEHLRWGWIPCGLHWKKADWVCRWFVRVGWVLIALSAVIQFFGALEHSG